MAPDLDLLPAGALFGIDQGRLSDNTPLELRSFDDRSDDVIGRGRSGPVVDRGRLGTATQQSPVESVNDLG
jgi:hypothetical protein